MEYLLVEFPESRGVIVDDLAEGKTNELLELEEGSHIVSLDGPADYLPEYREFILRRSSELYPRVISFEKV